MALSRRGFVQAAGIGSAAALTGAWIGARGREASLWSALRTDARGRRPGHDLPEQQREPARTGQDRDEGRARGVRRGWPHARTILVERRRPHRRDREEARRQAGEHRPRLRLDADPADGDAPLHGEGQGARRHDPDLRGVRRLRRDDGHPVRAVALDARLQDRPGQAGGCREGRGAGLLLQPEQPDGHLRRREGDARLPRAGSTASRPTRRSWSTRRTSTTSPIPITTRTSRSRVENPRVVVARTFSKAYGMAGLRIGYAVGHADTIKKMARLGRRHPARARSTSSRCTPGSRRSSRTRRSSPPSARATPPPATSR